MVTKKQKKSTKTGKGDTRAQRKRKANNLSLIPHALLEQLVCWKALPPAVREQAVHDHHHHEEDGTYQDFHRKYSDSAPSQSSPDGSEMALILSKNSFAVMALHRTDSLEALRKERGLDQFRERFIQQIQDNIDFDRGLEMLLADMNSRPEMLEKHGIRKAESLRDVAKVAPEITAAEIAWISTLEKVPSVYYDEGRGVPTILDFSVDGIEFGFDGLNAFDLQTEYSQDPFTSAGVTGATINAEFCPYRDIFANAFRGLAYLILSDAFIYQALYRENDAIALIKGDGRFKRALLERDPAAFGIKPEELQDKRIADLPLSKVQIVDLEERVRQHLDNKTFLDLGRNVSCSVKDLVTVVGLLERVPQTFLSLDAISGYLVPFGRGVKVLDHDGQELEYVPYHLYFQARAGEDLHDHTRNISRKDALLNFVFEAYAQSIEAREQYPEHLPADRLRKEFQQCFGIAIPTRATKSKYTPQEPSLFHTFGATTGTDSEMFSYTLKIGTFEIATLLEVITKLPRRLVPEIRTISREFEPADEAQMILGGLFTFGKYFDHRKEITLYTPEDASFAELSLVEQQIIRDTFVHELGHGIWKSFSDAQQSAWQMVSGADDLQRTDAAFKDRFIYDIDILRYVYTGPVLGVELSDADKPGPALFVEEDFCEHFSAYVDHGHEFKARAVQNAELQLKYDFFRTLFVEHCVDGENAEFDQQPLITLDDIRQRKIGAIRQISLKDALLNQEVQWQNREQRSREGREALFPSYEEMAGTAMPLEIRTHIYDRPHPEQLLVLRHVYSNISEGSRIIKIDPADLLPLLDSSPSEAQRYLAVRLSMEAEDAQELAAELHDILDEFRGSSEPSLLEQIAREVEREKNE